MTWCKSHCFPYSCFLSHAGAFWGAFLAPIHIVMAFNVIIFIWVIIMIQHVGGTCAAAQVKQYVEYKNIWFTHLMIQIGGVMVLSGPTWLLKFAFLTVSVPGLRKKFQMLFTVSNSFQSCLIFFFLCVLNKYRHTNHGDIFFFITKLSKKLSARVNNKC